MAKAAGRGRTRLHAFSAATGGLCRARAGANQGARRNALGGARGVAWRGLAQRHAQGGGARRARPASLKESAYGFLSRGRNSLSGRLIAPEQGRVMVLPPSVQV